MKYLHVLCLILITASAAVADDRPNIIFMIADDVSAEDLGCYGHKTLKTPHLDALAAQGMRFTNAYLTTSSCSPSRCSIISGRYPHNTGSPELHTTLPKGQPLFPKLLMDAGYYTVLSGKHHMGKYASTAFTKVSGGKGPGKQQDWVSILENRPKDKPFFCWFASSDAHRNWSIDNTAPKYTPDQMVVPPYLIDDEATRKDLTGYYHEVSRTDTYMGKVVAELKKQGIYENTLIIYCADNGRPFPRCKTRLYDSGIKTPFIVSWPKTIKPSVSESLVSVIDVSTTCLEIAGVKKAEAIQGVSFLPILKDPKATVRTVVFSEHNWHVYKNHERMVRFGNWLYIKNNFPGQANLCKEAFIGGAGESLLTAWRNDKLKPGQEMVFQTKAPAEELFHVSDDPDQLSNVAAETANKQVMEKMRKLLADWTKQTGDDVPEKPTADRDARPSKDEGKLGKKKGWKHAAPPGTASGATKINHAGPISVD
jgi:N-sulfoglucosamine sulfohydrolase